MIPCIFVKIIIIIYGIILPVYWSHKALKTHDAKETQRWLTYWMVFVIYIKVLSWVDFLVRFWLPFYNELILIMLVWLLNSELNGSAFLYNFYLEPFLSNYETEIESSIRKIGSTIIEVGLKISSKSIKLVTSAVLEQLKERNSGDIKGESSANLYEINRISVLDTFNDFLSFPGSRETLNVRRSAGKSSNDGCSQYVADSTEDSSICLSRHKKVCKSSNPFRSVTTSKKLQVKPHDKSFK
ncbi:Receptor expression-enhancing protein 2 [Araneus ventricosus]|uniref:Receptor expression-enhancing protein n=1 Tax=Araneus ventricosus TaxID=182803 RepID=A0A4Y2FGB2_ARAVE|nr:Receptor expression-enhancing protein 2 [Araneus ventricosus]